MRSRKLNEFVGGGKSRAGQNGVPRTMRLMGIEVEGWMS
jgi:hypothetical protein